MLAVLVGQIVRGARPPSASTTTRSVHWDRQTIVVLVRVERI